MFEIKKNSLLVSDIAAYLGTESIGKDREISQFVSPENLVKHSFSYLMNNEKISTDASECLILCTEDFVIQNHDLSYIRCKNPELSFYTVVNEFFVEPEEYGIDPTSKISDNALLGVNINIGANSFIGDNVDIGDSTYIGKNVIINNNVSLGRNCFIKDGSIIGSEGFNFIQDQNKLLHIPQIGKIVIEDNVWIGSNSVIEKATLNTTLIKAGVKIDDLVQIGNSCIVDTNTQIVSGCVIGAGAKIGANCFLGMNASIKENLVIGNDVKIGSGSAVITDIESGMTYAGVPAKKIVKRDV